MDDAPWRTDAVLNLCRAVREERRWDVLLILADALDEAGYPRPEVTAEMRRPESLADIPAFRLTALAMSDETAEAVRGLQALAAELGAGNAYSHDLPPDVERRPPVGLDDSYDDGRASHVEMTYDDLMKFARQWLDTDDGKWGGEYVTETGSDGWRDVMHLRAEEFWRLYQIVTGAKVRDPKASFFSCSC